MHLLLEGTEIFNIARERVFQMVTDVGFIAEQISESRSIKVTEGNAIEAQLKLEVLPPGITMSTKIRAVNIEHARSARLEVEGSGARSQLKVISDFGLEGENPTRMKWTADVEITGELARFGSDRIRRLTQKVVKEIFQGIRKSMDEG
jgi:carbon monoxide dehydrogenase subunit G